MGESYKRVYTMTNENVACLNSLYDFENANVLTILGSGDQYFTSLLNGASLVDVIDINYTAWLYFRLKFKAIKVLSYEEFTSLFVERKFNDIEVYNKLYTMLSYEELNYYIYLINRSIYDMKHSECFHPNTIINVKDKKRIIPYLGKNQYYLLQEIVRNRKLPKFYRGDFMGLNARGDYDILMLSNIYQYIDCGIEKFKEEIERYGNVDTLAKYSWELLDEEQRFIEHGFEVTEVDGVYTDKNYILSLRRR